MDTPSADTVPKQCHAIQAGFATQNNVYNEVRPPELWLGASIVSPTLKTEFNVRDAKNLGSENWETRELLLLWGNVCAAPPACGIEEDITIFAIQDFQSLIKFQRTH